MKDLGGAGSRGSRGGLGAGHDMYGATAGMCVVLECVCMCAL